MQADVFDVLLEVLQLEEAVVLAGSAGTTSALDLAIRHPDRVRALLRQRLSRAGSRDHVSRACRSLAWVHGGRHAAHVPAFDGWTSGIGDSARALMPRSIRRSIAKSPNSMSNTPRIAVSGCFQS